MVALGSRHSGLNRCSMPPADNETHTVEPMRVDMPKWASDLHRSVSSLAYTTSAPAKVPHLDIVDREEMLLQRPEVSFPVADQTQAALLWAEMASCSLAQMALWPQDAFAAPVAWTAPSPSPCRAPVAAAAPKFSSDCQPISERDDTTVIVRKVPGDVSRAAFLDTMDTEGLAGLYTFVYLPMNFEKGACLGYAIVNFADATSAAAGALSLSGVELGGKRLEASISEERQSLSDLILRYRDSAVMHSSVPDDCKPVLYSNGVAVPFPEPTKTLDPPVHTKAKRSAKRSAR